MISNHLNKKKQIFVGFMEVVSIATLYMKNIYTVYIFAFFSNIQVYEYIVN